MVFPACLPLTTDYFPDDVTLQSFYVFSNYNLLPEDVNAEVAMQRAVYRQPLSTLEVFYQMICQRLSQVNNNHFIKLYYTTFVSTAKSRSFISS